MAIKLSKRVNSIEESITLKLNSRANRLRKSGKTVYNLTAGQLPFRPHEQLITSLHRETHFLKSFQYSSVDGVQELRELILNRFIRSRQLSPEIDMACLVSNGAKHGLTNILATILNPQDEVIVITPCWLSSCFSGVMGRKSYRGRCRTAQRIYPSG
jgi:aspartate aminotransferase